MQSREVIARRADPSLPIDLYRTLFDADAGEVVDAEAPGGQALVAVVDEVTFKPDLSAEAGRAALRSQLGAAISAELVNAYVGALEEEIGVTRNDALIAEPFAGG